MAIEAITQKSENQCDSGHSIESYELEDISFAMPLIIPEDERGVETFLTLSPASLRATNDKEDQEAFVVSSISRIGANDHSTNHCFGHIRISYDVAKSSDATSDASCCELPSLLASQNSTHYAESWNSIFSRPLSQWYRMFASVGLNYGPFFRRLSGVMGKDNQARANVASNALRTGESRYVVHPTTLDCALQLCIIASSHEQFSRLRRAYIPSAIGHISVRPQSIQQTDEYMMSTAEGITYGTRGLLSNMTITSTRQGVVLRADKILLLTSDDISHTVSRNTEPFSRMVWIPDLDCLTSDSVTAIHPLVNVSDVAISPRLELLALNQAVQFYTEYMEFFKLGTREAHLQFFLDWIEERVEAARAGFYPHAKEVLASSEEARSENIKSLSESLKAISSEARLLCHMYENLPAIMRRERTGIQVALEEGRLGAMYKDAHRVSEGNRRLAAMWLLLRTKTPW